MRSRGGGGGGSEALLSVSMHEGSLGFTRLFAPNEGLAGTLRF